MGAHQTERQLVQTSAIREIIIKVAVGLALVFISTSGFIWYTTKRTAEKVGEQAQDITVLQKDVKDLTLDVSKLYNMADDVGEIKTDIREMKTMIYEELRKK